MSTKGNRIIYTGKQQLYTTKSIFDDCCKQWPKPSFLKPHLNLNEKYDAQQQQQQQDEADALYAFELHWVIPPASSASSSEQKQSEQELESSGNINYHLQLSSVNKPSERVSHLWADCYRIAVLLHAFYEKPYSALSIVIARNTQKAALKKVKASHLQHAKYGRNFAQKLGYTFLQYLLVEEKKQELLMIASAATKRSAEKPQNDSNQHDNNDISPMQKQQKHTMLQTLQKFDKTKLKTTQTKVRYNGCVDGKHGLSVNENQMDVDANEDTHNEQERSVWDEYARMYLSANLNEKYLSEWSKQYGFNEHLSNVRVGDILLTIPCVESSIWSRFVKCDYNPNFHYAVVVMVDEQNSTYVTLENWAVNDSNAFDTKWDFRVYATKKKQSYHEQLCNSGGYGNVALTLLLSLDP